jgi:SAM-dependent methyltransferase
MKNVDTKTVDSFADEWSRFDQKRVSSQESQKTFEEYFSVFPWDELPENSEGFDMGCGSGRWAAWVAPRVAKLNCIEPSGAIEVAKNNLLHFPNITFYRASVGENSLDNNTQDFGYCLGVLHHVPETEKAVKSCVELLKPGAPLLLYLYYSFDNRNFFFYLIWKLSDLVRLIICNLNPLFKNIITDIIAYFIYWPLAKISYFMDNLGLSVANIPLSYYRNHSFYTMRTDSRDRFGTPLEKRFTKSQITKMMESAGLEDIKFSDKEPFWCAVGRKKIK